MSSGWGSGRWCRVSRGPWGCQGEARTLAQLGPAEFLINEHTEDQRGWAEDRNTTFLDPPLLIQEWGVFKSTPSPTRKESGRSRGSKSGCGQRRRSLQALWAPV